MIEHASATFEVKSWDEKSFDDSEGMAKLTRVRATYTYQGDLEGEGVPESLMTYSEGGGAAHFVTLERVVGRLGGRAGSFVLQGNGTYTEAEGANSDFIVVPGSATGELNGLRGKGRYKAHRPPFTITMDYTFE